MAQVNDKPRFYGLLAEYESAQDLLDAVRATKKEGYTEIDAFTPYPVEAISLEVENGKKSQVSKLVGTGALLGFLTAAFGQWWMSAQAYPLNIGGRPLNSWPAFIPVAFELTVLFASFSAIGGMLFLNRLPRPNHPLFAVPQFERANIDRCFLLIKSEDAKYEEEKTRTFMEGLGPDEVIDVDWA